MTSRFIRFARNRLGLTRLLEDPTYKYRRVIELYIGAEIVIAVAAIINTLALNYDRKLTCTIMLAAVFLLMVALQGSFRRGREEFSLKITLWASSVAITFLIWTNDGLRDEAILGYCVILLFSAMFQTRKQYYAMMSAIMLSLASVVVAKDAGLIQYRFDFDWGNLATIVVVYALIGYCIQALSSDLREMVERYRDENEKVRSSEAEIMRLAYHDTLTGLPNRIIITRDFERAMALPEPDLALFFIDLDNFKAVNDTLGHAAGDELLQAITRQLSRCMPAGSTLCRMGGDEFLLLMSLKSNDDIAATAALIQRSVAVPLTINGTSILPTFSMGISRAPSDGTDFDTLQRKADIALYSAKAAGRNIFRIYEEAMNAESLAHLSLAGRLRDALANDEFQLHYQPKVSFQTEHIEGAEALLRWFPKDADPVMPDVFIPIAENTGSIVEIGKWVLNEACRQCREWQLNGFPDMTISVNISVIQFRRGNLEGLVTEALARSGLEPRYLDLELTESLLIEDEYDVAGQIRRICQKGVSFSIDDFGKGYSNLGNLGKFDIGTLKIDRHFVAHMLDTDKDKALVEAIIGMAKALGLETVAEGVESEAEKIELQSLGCSSGQGYLWSRPLHPQAFVKLAQLDRGRAVISPPLAAGAW